MFSQEQISQVIDAQRQTFLNKEGGVERKTLESISVLNGFATIITGIRRCGKSTLLLQLMQRYFKEFLFLNFEDIRLAGFDRDSLVLLHREIEKRKVKTLFFDELQLVQDWEIFINQLLREDYQVFITGSNASLLSSEFATHLTGRHLSHELFPFSFEEFLMLKKLPANEDSLLKYLFVGGMPEFAKTEQNILLTSLIDDILIKDIAVRHTIRDVDSIRKLTLFLLSNAGNLVSANKLTGLFGIKSVSTILEYFSYLTESYLVDFVPQFNYSTKAQIRNPKKIYAIDTGIAKNLEFSTTDNSGHLLENAIYLHLRKSGKDIFFFNENKHECDFVQMKKGKVVKLLQVCLQITQDNRLREVNGLIEAMRYFNFTKGMIITANQQDTIISDNMEIEIVPAWKFLLNDN